MNDSSVPEHLARYQRQTLLEQIGTDGQQRLLGASVLIVGCGALGTVSAEMLVRAGVGSARIVDRDIVELTNLQRQVLFDEEDVRNAMPKAEAARLKLGAINSSVRVDAHVEDFSHRTAERLCDGVDVIVDATDNFETRFLINDVAVSRGIPWVYGGAVATSGMTMTFLPRGDSRPWSGHRTPCLRCVFEQAPPTGARMTCDTVGVLGPVVSTIASIQAAEAIKVLLGKFDAINRRLLSVDLWCMDITQLDITGALNDACPCCGKRDFEYLKGEGAADAVTLCGRDAVQITPADRGLLLLDRVLEVLSSHGTFEATRFTLRGTFTDEMGEGGEPIELTLFPDGRAILRGTTDAVRARSLYARYVGS